MTINPRLPPPVACSASPATASAATAGTPAQRPAPTPPPDTRRQGSSGCGFFDCIARGVVVFGNALVRLWQYLRLCLSEGTCRPTLGRAAPTAGKDRPPVILLGGQGDAASLSLGVFARSLTRDGFRVYVLDDPEHALESHRDAARLLDRLVSRVRSENGGSKVSLVGYSTGGTNARAYVSLFGGADNVDRVVQMAGSNNGDPHALSFCASGREEMLGSPFMNALESRANPVAVYSIYEAGPNGDGVIEPSDARLSSGPRNHNLPLAQWQKNGGPLISCDHVNMPFDGRVYARVTEALLASP